MTKCQSSMRSENGKPQIKYKGIHEPKGRVKGYRVEIRPSNSQKIWVGTFDARTKAMRAFDAAVYLTGKEPYYFIYPENYFPTRLTKPPREYVQTEAKKFADRTDALEENPTSFLVDISKARSVETAPDMKAVKASDSFVNLDESLKDAGYLRVSAEQFPALEDTTYSDLFVEDTKFDVEETKAGLVGAKNSVEKLKNWMEVKSCGEEAEDWEELKFFYDKGYEHPNPEVISDLLDRQPPETFLPWIDGGSFMPNLASRPCFKRKRDDATEDASILPAVGSFRVGDTDVGESSWWLDYFSGPVDQELDLFGTTQPGFSPATVVFSDFGDQNCGTRF